MTKMKQFITYIFILFFGLTAGAQDLPQVQMAADTTQIRIGEQIKLSVTAKADTLSFVDFPELSSLGDLEVVKSSQIDTLQAKPIRKLQKNYFITQWDSGAYKVPPIQIKVNDSILTTDSLQIKVLPMVVDTTKQGLYGFKAPVNIEGKSIDELPNSNNYWWWLIALLMLGGIAYYFYRQRQKALEAKHILTPYEIAIKQLEALSNDKLWLRNQVDLHYLKLTDTLKDYLERELGIPAKEQISSELLQSLKKYRFENGSYFTPELLERLEQTLKRADLAKFAKLAPNPADIDLDFNVVKDVINYAHQIVQSIADEKAAELAAIEAAKKRQKRRLAIALGSIALIISLIGGVGYYYLNKMKLTGQIKENMSASEWVYNEYGSEPSLGITTPHILHSVDISETLDSLPGQVKKMIDEVSVYADENLIKKYAIIAVSIDFKQKLPEKTDLSKLAITSVLQQIKARNVNLQSADIDGGKRYFGSFTIDVPVVGNNLKVMFDSRVYPTASGLKMLMGMYLEGNKDNEALIDRVMSSAELIK
jgi:hypothetical protein